MTHLFGEYAGAREPGQSGDRAGSGLRGTPRSQDARPRSWSRLRSGWPWPCMAACFPQWSTTTMSRGRDLTTGRRPKGLLEQL